MGEVTHSGTAGAALPLTPDIVGLFNDQVLVQLDTLGLMDACPFYGLKSLNGQYPVINSWRGLDLRNGDPRTAVDWNSGDYVPIKVSFDVRTWSATRKNLCEFTVNRDVDASNVAVLGQSLTEVSQQSAVGMVADTVALMIADLLTTTGNYASGHAVDVGNFTSSTFDADGLAFQAVQDLFVTARKWRDVDPSRYVLVADDLWRYIRELEQGQKSEMATGTGRRVGDADIRQYIAERAFCSPERVHRINGRYINASGSKTRFATGCMIIGHAAPGMGSSFLKGIVPDGNITSSVLKGDALPGVARLRSDYDVRKNADIYVADMVWTPQVQDPEAAVLIYGGLS